MRAGALTERVAFDAPSGGTDGFGGSEVGWAEQFERRAQFVYQRGDEAVEAARLAGRSIYKVRVRSSSDTRGITTDWRMRDVRRGVTYNIREVDAVTDRQRGWVHIVVESGVAT